LIIKVAKDFNKKSIEYNTNKDADKLSGKEKQALYAKILSKNAGFDVLNKG
jgi:hypothetical protein